MMTIAVKLFKELSTKELYGILQLRSAVFVVEQDCVYQDLDGKDEKAIHVIGTKNDVIIAYTRVFKPGDYFDVAGIGRVVVSPTERTHGYGKVIMDVSINVVQEKLGETSIKLSAQTYLKPFYNSLGFKEVGKGYLEDGIPHISMVKG